MEIHLQNRRWFFKITFFTTIQWKLADSYQKERFFFFKGHCLINLGCPSVLKNTSSKINCQKQNFRITIPESLLSHIKSGINHCTKDIAMYNRLNVKANNSIPMYSGET